MYLPQKSILVTIFHEYHDKNWHINIQFAWLFFHQWAQNQMHFNHRTNLRHRSEASTYVRSYGCLCQPSCMLWLALMISPAGTHSLRLWVINDNSSGVGGYLYQAEDVTLTKSLTNYSETPERQTETQTISTDTRRLLCLTAGLISPTHSDTKRDCNWMKRNFWRRELWRKRTQ